MCRRHTTGIIDTHRNVSDASTFDIFDDIVDIETITTSYYLLRGISFNISDNIIYSIIVILYLYLVVVIYSVLCDKKRPLENGSISYIEMLATH